MTEQTPNRSASVVAHANITELELQFAQNPESDAYVPLCRAYLQQSRFMEAMVVCKKGIKAHPDSMEARLLLAEVYRQQKKFKRALKELDQLADQHQETGAVYLARGRVRGLAGDESGSTEDLKRSLDLDASLGEASQLLAERGITYPEPVVVPEPPPPGPRSYSGIGPAGAADTADIAVPNSSPTSSPNSSPGAQPISNPQMRVAPSRVASEVYSPHGYPQAEDGSYRIAPQRLEGEDKLEALAQKVAAEKPDNGKPVTTLILLGVLTLVGVIGLAVVFINKRRVEGTDRLTNQSFAAFKKDTYGSYKNAAVLLEELLSEYDDDHQLSLARLAHTYAILVSEHGEKSLQPNLDAAIASAKAKAPRVSHTVAAEALVALYSAADQKAGAEKAWTILDPFIKASQGAPPTYADLEMAVVELAKGDAEAATQRLAVTKDMLAGSVRARVWHARAAARASRFATALNAYQATLRSEADHPGARAGLALVRLARGDLNGAAQDLTRFDKYAIDNPKEISNKDRALAEYARSEILDSAGEQSKATGAYELAVRLDPENADFPYRRGKILMEAQRTKDAIKYFREAVKKDSKRIPFLVELAEAEMRTGDFASAKKHIADARSKDPDDVNAATAMARFMRRTKKPDAETFIKSLGEKWPRRAKVQMHLELGRLYRSQKKLEKAKTQLELAIESMGSKSPAKQAEVLLSYAKLMGDRGETATAVNAFRKAAEMGELEGWFRLSRLLAPVDKKKALQACNRYLAGGASLRYAQPARDLCRSLK